jgi:hypothetical protein
MFFSKTRTFLENEAWSPWRTGDTKRTIYHYTTAAGLHGIVTQRKLRLTHTQHLNDETEGLHGAKAVDQALDILSKQLPTSELVIRLSQAMKTAISQRQIHVEVDGGTYVGCFSTECDSLPQWRGYGHHDSAFALAFNAEELFKLARGSWGGRCWLLPVEYDETAFISKMAKALTIAAEEFDDHKSIEHPQRLLYSLVLHLANYGSALKHHAFKEEREWRLIVLQLPTDDIPVQHLPSATFRPYIELDMGNEILANALERIIVGPQLTQEATVHGVGSFLRRQLSVEVPIVRSSIPFNARI